MWTEEFYIADSTRGAASVLGGKRLKSNGMNRAVDVARSGDQQGDVWQGGEQLGNRGAGPGVGARVRGRWSCAQRGAGEGRGKGKGVILDTRYDSHTIHNIQQNIYEYTPLPRVSTN
jgi:hypothetical protein